ncbi:phosphatidate cytidylyltransferase [Lactobacillus sp.]|uniref:phosphatidate cytidylyltransferase n=1 Tax=Lactobacillus sp. TaxID=1591 RepID=UPI003EF6FEDD
MKQRVITAIIALLIFIPILLAGGMWIDWLAAILAAIGISEVFLMKKQILVSVDFTLACLATLTWTVPSAFFNFLPPHWSKWGIFYALVMLLLTWTVLSKNKTTFDDIGVYVLSSLYIGTGFHYLAALRNSGTYGLWRILFAFIVVWTTDTAAYMVGRKLGKHKLWPVISPNKTWEGSIGAVIIAVIISAIYVNLVPMGADKTTLIIASFFLSIVGQMGDLVESAYKRFYGVKDSGKILPGHGGILDRFDSTLFVLPIVALIFGI